MSPTELAYLAGIIDGEGCIYIEPNTHGKAFRLRLVIVSTDKILIEWLVSKTQVGTVQERFPKQNNRRKFFSFRVSSVQAASIIKSALPFLVIKKRQAEIAITFSEGKNKLKGRNTPNPETMKVNLAFQKDCHAELTSLHQ